MTEREFLGIDPGMDGAAVLLRGREVMEVRLFRDLLITTSAHKNTYDFGAVFRMLGPLAGGSRGTVMVIEDGRGTPAGATSTAARAVGLAYGMLRMAAAALECPVVSVQPTAWHARLFGRNSTLEPKARAAIFVRDEFPAFDPRLGRFKRGHSGVIDALCLARYGATRELTLEDNP